MLKIHNLTPDSFHRQFLLSKQKSTLISDYCHVCGIDFKFDEDSYLCEVELPKFEIKNLPDDSSLLEMLDWNFLVKNPSKKLIITHRIIYNLEHYLEKLNNLVLKHNLKDRVYWFTFNPLDFRLKHKCKFKLLFLDSLTNVFFEGRINNFAKNNLDLSSFFKYQYGFEPKYSTFKKLDIDKCDSYFMSSSATTKAHRLLSTYLIKECIGLDKGIVTFHGHNHRYVHLEDYLKSEKDQLIKHNLDITNILNFRTFRGRNFDTIDYSFFERSLTHSYLNVYETCLINYVQESTANEIEIFITEKTWINYAHGKPFLLNGNKDSLRWLSKYYGFKSFSSLFDESYDSMDNFVDRAYYTVNELTKFCSLPFEKAKDKVKQIQEVTDHNYNVFHSINHKERFFKIFNGI